MEIDRGRTRRPWGDVGAWGGRPAYPTTRNRSCLMAVPLFVAGVTSFSRNRFAFCGTGLYVAKI